MVKDPWLNNVWMMPPSCLPFVDDYDMVVHIDGDCVVTGPMTNYLKVMRTLLEFVTTTH